MSKIKKLVFKEFGFPIELRNVPTIEVRGSIEPNINYKILTQKVITELCSSSNHAYLTGHQVLFLRKKLEMPTREFGDFMDTSHAAVVKWEKRGDLPTLMNKANEILLRTKVLIRFGVKPALFLDIMDLEIKAPAKEGPMVLYLSN